MTAPNDRSVISYFAPLQQILSFAKSAKALATGRIQEIPAGTLRDGFDPAALVPVEQLNELIKYACDGIGFLLRGATSNAARAGAVTYWQYLQDLAAGAGAGRVGIVGAEVDTKALLADVWNVSMEDNLWGSAMAADADGFYACLTLNTVNKLDRTTGAILWTFTFPFGDGYAKGLVPGGDGYLYVSMASNTNGKWWFKLNTATGAEVSQTAMTTGTTVVQTPFRVRSNGVFLAAQVGTNNALLGIYRLSSGFGSPVATWDHTNYSLRDYIVMGDYLYAIGTHNSTSIFQFWKVKLSDGSVVTQAGSPVAQVMCGDGRMLYLAGDPDNGSSGKEELWTVETATLKVVAKTSIGLTPSGTSGNTVSAIACDGRRVIVSYWDADGSALGSGTDPQGELHLFQTPSLTRLGYCLNETTAGTTNHDGFVDGLDMDGIDAYYVRPVGDFKGVRRINLQTGPRAFQVGPFNTNAAPWANKKAIPQS